MFLQSLKLTNLLSFGSESEEITLRPLNVMIGPNGAGKTNLLAAINLLRAAPSSIHAPIRKGGGVGEWIWKGGGTGEGASIEAVLKLPSDNRNFRYKLSFTEYRSHFQIKDERLEMAAPVHGKKEPYLYYKFQDGKGVLNINGKARKLSIEEIDLTNSILQQRKDPINYPELTQISAEFSMIRLYQDWTYGSSANLRGPQQNDLPQAFPDADTTNLALVLASYGRMPENKKMLLENLKELYSGIEEVNVVPEGGALVIYLNEYGRSIPTSRLSDGTLRYLFLLAILCHPNPPRLICIEEPELGLHPDLIGRLAKLLQSASQRTQLIVTTHSVGLVDALSNEPESILVCEREETGTMLRRLDPEDCQGWLEDYRLGQAWVRGVIGGNRW